MPTLHERPEGIMHQGVAKPPNHPRSQIMALRTSLVNLRARLLKLADRLSFLGPALARFTVGVVFISTGWGKLHGIADVTEFFTELHIPAPHFNAVLVASTEFFGGALLLLGLCTRLAALPLAFAMLIALITAKLPKAEGFTDFLGFEEVTYLVVFLWLALAGPGSLSLDRLIARRAERASR
jgi:putative oxidoreductase